MTKSEIKKIIWLNLNSGKLIKSKKLAYILLFLFVFVSFTLILAWKYFPSRAYQEGIVAPRDVISPRNFEVENESATRDAQSKAMNMVQPVYKVNSGILSQVDEELKQQFRLIGLLKKSNANETPDKNRELKSQLPISLSDSSLNTLINSEPRTFEQIEILTRNIVARSMHEIIKDNDSQSLSQAVEEVRNYSASLSLPEKQQKAISELAAASIRPNSLIDWEETSRLRQERKDSVKPVMVTIKTGQIIVNKGSIITPEHIRIIEKMGLQRSHINLTGIGGTAIFTLISIFIMWRFIKITLPLLADSPNMLLLLILIAVGILLMSSLLTQFNPYWAPVPIAAMLTAILINPFAGLMITAFLSICIGILTGEVQFAATALVTGFASIVTVWRVYRRMDLITASITVFIINELSILTFFLLQGETARGLIENLVYGGINGFSSGIVTIGLLPLMEHGFSITTTIKLLELSNQSEPLLKQLLMEAPGTYHHSIIVGNLAEAGAEAVGEDPLLCRVASYYHDIGKLKRPYFYIENQLGSENPHNKLSPNLSALIIIAHTKDGLEIGRKHKLPDPILDIIHQHHGTNLVSYFYHQAQQLDKDNPPDEKDFRYPGPKPISKAAAIVMLADAVEASARTLNNPTPDLIETHVKTIFRKFMDDGQLEESPLSIKNVNDLMETFTRILTGIYHHRIEYPDQIMEEMQTTEKISRLKIANYKNHTK